MLAEYRGTKVAIKRALTPGDGKRGGSKGGSKVGSKTTKSKDIALLAGTDSQDSALRNHRRTEEESTDELETQDIEANPGYASSGSMSVRSFNASGTGTGYGGGLSKNIDFLLSGLSFEHKKTKLQVMFPWFFPDKRGTSKANIIGSASGEEATTSASTVARICPWLDGQKRGKEEFIIEMRLLSRLRHPCITTVMGAVISTTEPMLVMGKFYINGVSRDASHVIVDI